MTGDGFSMTPSVIHIPVLLITLITKRICIKSGIFPVIRKFFQNSIPGTAGGARNVRIMTAPVPLRLHFFKTGGTDGNIGRCKHFIFAFPAGNGSKSGKRRKRSFFSLYALHKGRPFHLLKPAKESVYLFPCPGDVYFHFAAEVLYRACQFQFFCHAADGRTETDPLHSAGHAEPFRHLMFHTRLPKNYFFEIFISHSAAASYPSPVFPHTLNTGASLFKWRIPSIKNASSKSR